MSPNEDRDFGQGFFFFRFSVVFFFLFLFTVSSAPRRGKHLVPSNCLINICCVNGNGMYKMLWEQSGETRTKRRRNI